VQIHQANDSPNLTGDSPRNFGSHARTRVNKVSLPFRTAAATDGAAHTAANQPLGAWGQNPLNYPRVLHISAMR